MWSSAQIVVKYPRIKGGKTHVQQQERTPQETSRPTSHTPHAQPNPGHARERRPHPDDHQAEAGSRVAVPQRRPSHQPLQAAIAHCLPRGFVHFGI